MLFNIIMWILLTLLALIGLSAVIRGLSHILLCDGMPKNCCTLILLSGENADIMLKSAIEQISYEAAFDSRIGGTMSKIVAVNMGLDEQGFEMCDKICAENSIDLCSSDRLSDYLYNMQANLQQKRAKK